MRRLTRFLLHVLLILPTIFLLGCGGSSNSGGDSGPSVGPVPGPWHSEYVRFFVSGDGNELTTTGSTLEKSCSLQFGPYTWTNVGRCSKVTITSRFTGNIPISNGSFHLESPGLDIMGNFTTSGSCSGQYSFSRYSDGCRTTLTASGSFNASPQSGSDLAEIGTPDHIEREVNPLTGETLFEIEYRYK